ncbi:Inter-alpha-trypsin inhibitor heavy chain H2 [Saguinus oedipus]|uniref:Inter-alpha-trypsin inhibitor heavy chain H2 n=1 Tax=Saguinus oedipus TaxID=9490 RepID=A0ABQ9V833_SAGOE|nr:Inter-alpha-trypsin inhibitor heavy chain H2 [Saguinus oedipus]
MAFSKRDSLVIRAKSAFCCRVKSLSPVRKPLWESKLLGMFGALYYGSKVPSSSIPSWASPSPTPVTSMQAEGAKVLESTPPPHVMRVENDPHFIIYLPKSQKNICFNIDSEPGKILNLVSDPESGIAVNGQLVGAKKPNNGKLSTYFGKLGFYFQSEDMKIEISTKTITLSRGPSTYTLSWADTAQIMNQRQFMQEPKIHIFNERPGKDPKKPEASMEVKGQKLIVTRGLQKDYRTDVVFGTDVPCWFVHNSGKGFIDGHYKEYFVPQLYSFLRRP